MERLRFFRTWVLAVVLGLFGSACGGRSTSLDFDLIDPVPPLPDAAREAAPPPPPRDAPVPRDAGADRGSDRDGPVRDAGRDVSPQDRLISIAIVPSSVTLPRNMTTRIRVSATYTSGAVVDITERANLRSDKPNVASVTPNGVVTALMPGGAVIFAVFEGQIASASIVVAPDTGPPTDLIVTPNSMVVEAGSTVEFNAIVRRQGNFFQDVTKSATWTSSNESVAIVRLGRALAIAPGNITITASSNGLKGAATLVVSRDSIQRLEISPRVDVIDVDSSVFVRASAFTARGLEYDVEGFVEWSSSQPGIVRIAGTELWGVSVGTSVITAKLGTFVATMPVRVSNAKLVSITVTPSMSTVQFPEMQHLTATGQYSDGTTRDITRIASWFVEDDTMGAVSIQSEGVVESVGIGTATVVAAIDEVRGTAKVTVGPGSPTSLRMEPAIPMPRHAVQSQPVFANYDNGASIDVSSLVAWSIADPSIASVELYFNQAMLSCNAIGRTRILATFVGKSASTDVSCTSSALQMLEVSPMFSTVSLSAMDTIPMAVTAYFADGSTYEVQAAAVWSADDQNILSVSNAPNERGLVRPKRLGATRVIATRGGLQGIATITVTD